MKRTLKEHFSGKDHVSQVMDGSWLDSCGTKICSVSFQADNPVLPNNLQTFGVSQWVIDRDKTKHEYQVSS